MTTVTFKLTGIANGGAAIGRDESNRVIFVPHAIPGERVSVEVIREKKRFAHGQLLEILEPSSHRVEPLCPHFGPCGGCHFQHIDYPTQLDLKREIILDQLTRIGGFANPLIRPVIPNQEEWAYSNYVAFSVDQAGNLGFWSPQLDAVIAVSTCHIIQPAILDQMKNLEVALPALQELTLRYGSDDSLMAILTLEDIETPSLETGLPISVIQMLPDQTAITLIGDSFLTFSVSDVDFRVSSTSFFYPSLTALDSLIKTVMEFASLTGGENVLDVYCGVGTLSAFLAPVAENVTGIDIDSVAINDAAANLDFFDNVVLYEGDVEEILPLIEITPDVTIVDPPVTGLAPPVHDALIDVDSPILIYIGSDMATFARDSRRLAKKGYDLIEVQPIDMYPQNYRVLAVAKWQMRK